MLKKQWVCYMVDEVTFVLKLLEDNWTSNLSAGLTGHKPASTSVNFIDVIPNLYKTFGF